jgi:HemX protein
MAAAGVGMHALALAGFTIAYGQLPLVGLAPSLSTLALIIGAGLVATLGLGEGRRVGIVIVPGVIVLQGIAVSLGFEATPELLDFQGAWFVFHVTLAFLGLCGMALAFAAGLLYLVQLRELNTKRLGRLFQFTPPLATLDRLGRVGLVSGFSAFTLSIVLGWAWTVSFRHSLDQTNPKIVWAVLSWLVFVAALGSRAGGGLKERRSALTSVIGFTFIIVSYLALRLVSTDGGFFL